MDIFTLQKKIQADKEVRKIIESGEVPVVDLSIFDCLDNLNISDDNNILHNYCKGKKNF